MKQINEKETLQYFSNISTVRDQCTKEQLGKFVGLMHENGQNSIMRRMDSEQALKINQYKQLQRFNLRKREDLTQR